MAAYIPISAQGEEAVEAAAVATGTCVALVVLTVAVGSPRYGITAKGIVAAARAVT